MATDETRIIYYNCNTTPATGQETRNPKLETRNNTKQGAFRGIIKHGFEFCTLDLLRISCFEFITLF